MREILRVAALAASIMTVGTACRPTSAANSSTTKSEAEREERPLDQIQLPPGFKIELYAEAKGARSMVLSPSGTLYVGTGGFSDPETKVYAIRDENGDGIGESVRTIIDLAGGDSPNPNGVAFKDGDLYVADRYRLLKYADVERNLDSVGAPEVIFDDFPRRSSHSWKYLSFGPDGKLYVPVGAPCNICDPDADAVTRGKFARIFSVNTDGSDFAEVASGVRNTVGFDWHPVTGELWFTENGRDSLGDNIPPDELNRVTERGQFFGYPLCHGRAIPDPQFNAGGTRLGCQGATGFVKPMRELGAHVAALGMRFYRGSMFPAAYRNQIFIAEHGSWNSSVPIGYRVTLVKRAADGSYTYEPFASGWLAENGDVWGRPVDVINMPDGAILVSDDQGGAIYRISYQP